MQMPVKMISPKNSFRLTIVFNDFVCKQKDNN